MNDAWAPVALAWSLVRAGDVILAGPTRLPWAVISLGAGGEVVAVRGAATHQATPDPDALVDVLCPVAERAALAALRKGLDARIVSRAVPG